MLILRDKIIFVDGKPVKLYSLDGRIWFSRARDVTAFKQRQAHAKAAAQASLAHATHLPWLQPYSWMGFDR
jgi:hypothetical protein